MKRYIGLALSLALVALALPAAPVVAATPVNNATHLYSLDGWGGIHPVGASPVMAPSAYWPGWDIARGMALFDDGTGGYTLDGWGGVHRFGSATALADSSHAYWPGWDIARAVVMAPWATPANPAGWTLDGWGGVHAFGGAPAVPDSSHDYWRGWDIARGLVVFPDSASGRVSGYILDGWGGLHPFAGGGAAMPPAVTATAYWAGGTSPVRWHCCPAATPATCSTAGAASMPSRPPGCPCPTCCPTRRTRTGPGGTLPAV